MPSLQIRNLPDDLYQALAFRAEQSHRSLSQEALSVLRDSLKANAAVGRAQILRNIAHDIAANGVRSVSVSPESLLREDRER